MSNSLLANNLPASPELGFKNNISYNCIAIFIITRAATCGDGYDGGNDFNDIKWVHLLMAASWSNSFPEVLSISCEQRVSLELGKYTL